MRASNSSRVQQSIFEIVGRDALDAARADERVPLLDDSDTGSRIFPRAVASHSRTSSTTTPPRRSAPAKDVKTRSRL